MYTQHPTTNTTIYIFFGLFNDTELIGYIYIYMKFNSKGSSSLEVKNSH